MRMTILVPGLLALGLAHGHGAAPAEGAQLTKAAASRAAVTTVHSTVVSLVDYDELLAKYEADLAKHERALDGARSLKDRNKLAAKHPAKAYWRKFDSLGRKGEGRAVLWQMLSVESAGFDEKKAAKEGAKALKTLSEKYVAEPWFGAALEAAYKRKDELGEEVLGELYGAVLEGSSDVHVQAQALYRLAWIDKRAGRKDEAEARFQELAQEFRKTLYGTRAAATRTKPEEVEKGSEAPDFYGETLEGHGVSLSDYRGKVVLLDFYGFW